ncbi:MAG: hypothetical protein ACI35Q_08360 [Marinilabiliaceae bacterium]
MANSFGKGIAMNCGFDVGSQELVDNRGRCDTLAERDALEDIKRAVGLQVFVRETDTVYVWNGTEWLPVGGAANDEGEYQVFENHFLASQAGNALEDCHNSETSKTDCLS